MKANFRWLPACVFFIATLARAEVTVSELKTLQDTYNAKVQAAVTPHDAGVASLKTKYLAALDRALEAAKQAGKLEEALALKVEQQNATAGGINVPAQDAPATPASLAQLHDAYRKALATLDGDLAKALNPLRESFSKSLGALVTTLTKQGKLEEGLAVKKVLDGLPAASAPAALPSPKPAAVAAASAPGGAIGGDWGKPFKENRPQCLLVGFVLTYGEDAGNVVIQSAQAIWSNEGGEFKGHTYGKPRGTPLVVKARPGYAVGAMEGRGGTKVDNLQITFMKLKMGQLDPGDAYKSDLLGGKGGLGLKTLSGGGKPVTGIFGGSGGDLNSLGLSFQ